MVLATPQRKKNQHTKPGQEGVHDTLLGWGSTGAEAPTFLPVSHTKLSRALPPQQPQSYSQANHAGLSFQASQQAPPPASRQMGLCCPHFTTHRGGKKTMRGKREKKPQTAQMVGGGRDTRCKGDQALGFVHPPPGPWVQE